MADQSPAGLLEIPGLYKLLIFFNRSLESTFLLLAYITPCSRLNVSALTSKGEGCRLADAPPEGLR